MLTASKRAFKTRQTLLIDPVARMFTDLMNRKDMAPALVTRGQ